MDGLLIILIVACVASWALVGWLKYDNDQMVLELARWRRDYVKLSQSQKLDVRRPDLRPSAQIIPLRSADLGGKHRPEVVHIPNRGTINEGDKPVFPRGV